MQLLRLPRDNVQIDVQPAVAIHAGGHSGDPAASAQPIRQVPLHPGHALVTQGLFARNARKRARVHARFGSRPALTHRQTTCWNDE
jgi:hypothetical protein